MKHSCYLAGPISGLSYNDSIAWRTTIQKQLADVGIVGMSPLRHTEYLQSESDIKDSYENHVLSSKKGIFTKAYFDCSQCDVLLVNMLHAKTVSIGTVMEIAWAYSFNKPIILVMDKDNIHNHAMIHEARPLIVKNMNEAFDTVVSLLTP